MALRGLGRKQATPEADTQSVRKFARQLDGVQILRGKLIDVAYPAGSQSVLAYHGLARGYVGGFIAGSTGFFAGAVADPKVTSQAGEDPARSFFLTCPVGPTVDCVVTVWMF